MKILLPIYSMADARLIVDFVVNYRWPAPASFKLIHVLGSMATEEAYEQAEAAAGNLLMEVAARLVESLPQAQVSSEILSGDAAYEVIGEAGRWHAQMIVMGYRTRTDIQGMLAGSVSKAVVMQAPCSVAVLRPVVAADDQAGAFQSSADTEGGKASGCLSESVPDRQIRAV